MYPVIFHPKALERLNALDRSVQMKLYKKIAQLENGLPARHLKHGLPYFVVELGSYRIAFVVEPDKTRKIFFVGDHKEYKNWYKSLI